MSATMEIFPYRVRLAQSGKRFRLSAAAMRNLRPSWWFFTAPVEGSERTDLRCVVRTLWLSANRIRCKQGHNTGPGVSVRLQTEPDEAGDTIEFVLEFACETEAERMQAADRMLGSLLSHSTPDWLFDDHCVCVQVPLQ